MVEQYLPLYRKYRPQQFSDLIGQENLVKAMTNAISTGKIAHAYLFCGPRGTGKTSSARILAKSLNCQKGPTTTPCGTCPSCQDILNGNMLDVIEMDAASNRSVEDAQNIIDKIHYAPVNGKYKIFIIDEVHMISKTAFNALLKTLEEPPENVIFILATTEPQKVLETIISRCQRFDFRRITIDDIVKRLKYVVEQEKIKITDDALFVIAKNSQGGMRDALALLDQISVLDVENEITPEQVNEVLGKISSKVLSEISQAIFDNNVDTTIQKINEIYSKGNEPLQIIENFIHYYRNLSVAKSCKDIRVISDLTLLPEDTINEMKKQTQDIEISKIAKIIEKLTSYHKEIKFTNNRYLWLELCFIDLASMSDNEVMPRDIQTTVQTVVQPVVQPIKTVVEPQIPVLPQKQEQKDNPTQNNDNDIQAETVSKPVDELVKNATSPVSNNPVPAAKSGNSEGDWHSVIGTISSPPAKSFFNTFAKPVELNKEKVIITFKDGNLQEKAKEPMKYNALKNACLAYFNVTAIDIEMRIGAVPNLSAQTVPTPPKAQPVKNQTTVEKEAPVSKPITMSNSSIPQNTEQESSETEDNEDIEETIKEVEISIKDNDNPNLTEEVNMVKNLFDAKVFED